MSIEKKHIVYTAADIQKYLSGGMSNAEMYAIEKAAMDDPFLAEAIEGYEEMEEKDWSKELIALKQRLEAIENTTVVPLYKSSFTKWWKAAAAVVVIGSSVAVAYLFTNKKIDKNETIASVKAVTDSIAVAKIDTSRSATDVIVTPPVISQNKNTTSAAVTYYADSAKQSLASDVAVLEKRSDDFVYTPPAAPANENKDLAAGRRDEERQKVTDEAVAINPGAASNAQGYELNKSNADNNGLILQNDKAKNDNTKFLNKASNNYFNAQVVTADDKPVAFANVFVPKNSKPVYTDAQGNFKLAATDSNLNVVVTSAGYAPQKFRLLNSAAQNKIVLQPNDIAVKEISAGKKKAAAKAELKREATNAEMDEEDDAEPSGGWVEYNSYLSNNLVFPNEAKEKNIHGEVEVFVKLKSNGDISKIKVGKPLCDECDAEAIRLVKEGPRWEVKKNKASKVKVKIKF